MTCHDKRPGIHSVRENGDPETYNDNGDGFCEKVCREGTD